VADDGESLVGLLEAAVHVVLERLGRDLADLGLTHGEVNALAHLEGETSVAQLLRRTGQRASTLSGIVDRLERRELVVRAIHPTDRRSFVLRLTPEGEAAAARVREAFRAIEDDVRRRVPDRSVAGFRHVVEAFAEQPA
jgi:DNA-binding MarR family transcriptional regulator